jgi:DNA-binding protein H-NS
LQADKATIVGEAVTYIRTLEGTLKKLEKMKVERKRALAAQQQHGQQQLAVGAGSSRTSSALHPAPPALPAPAPATSSSREANLADMVHGLAQQAAVAAANKALAAAASAAAVGVGGSSSSGASAQLPRGAVPFPAPVAGFQTWSGQNVVVSVANNEAYINLHCPREPGTLTKALFVLERHSIEVVTTTISADDGFRMYGIHARVSHQTSITSWVFLLL